MIAFAKPHWRVSRLLRNALNETSERLISKGAKQIHPSQRSGAKHGPEDYNGTGVSGFLAGEGCKMVSAKGYPGIYAHFQKPNSAKSESTSS